MAETWRHPEAIVTTERLEAQLSDPALRLYDCTFYLHYESGTGRPYSVESGRADYLKAHIPGSAFLDLQADFSDADSPYSFTLLSPDRVAEAFMRHGVGEGTRVVLYSRGSPTRATRFWWMLRWLGFDDAAVLDGGWEKWQADGRPVEPGPRSYVPGRFTPRPRPQLFVSKQEMLAAIGDGAACSLNALDAEIHSGANPRYGRPGRIPGSSNVPASTLIDPGTREFRPPAEVAAAFRSAGASSDKRVLNYCGGGIAATLDAFLQHQLGYPDIAVYDASMSEWATDASLPIERD